MARRGSPGTQARRAALRELRDAADHGIVPELAPAGLELGQYAGFWVAPDRRVYAAAAAPRQRLRAVAVMVDPCGCGAADGQCGLEYRPSVTWTPAVEAWLTNAAWWRAADGSWLAVTDSPTAPRSVRP